jgi:hypothetical protein
MYENLRHGAHAGVRGSASRGIDPTQHHKFVALGTATCVEFVRVRNDASARVRWPVQTHFIDLLHGVSSAKHPDILVRVSFFARDDDIC